MLLLCLHAANEVLVMLHVWRVTRSFLFKTMTLSWFEALETSTVNTGAEPAHPSGMYGIRKVCKGKNNIRFGDKGSLW